MIWSEKKRWAFLGIPLTFTTYSLTEDKIIVDSGLFITKQEEVLLYRVLDISVTRGILQRLSGLGTIVIVSSDKTTPTLKIKNIPRVQKVKDQICELVEQAKERKQVYSREILGNPDLNEFVD